MSEPEEPEEYTPEDQTQPDQEWDVSNDEYVKRLILQSLKFNLSRKDRAEKTLTEGREDFHKFRDNMMNEIDKARKHVEKLVRIAEEKGFELEDTVKQQVESAGQPSTIEIEVQLDKDYEKKREEERRKEQEKKDTEDRARLMEMINSKRRAIFDGYKMHWS
jgi:hypothetical protein